MIWPDWSAQTVLIVAGGSSACQALTLNRGLFERSIVVNLAYRLLPLADVLYAGDSAFWTHYVSARYFRGLKVATQSCRCYSELLAGVTPKDSQGLLFDTIGVVGNGGGNSGFQAINLAVQFGAKNLILAGFDFAGTHWHAQHPSCLGNPSELQFARWLEHFTFALSQLEQRGIGVKRLGA